jgi:hypothetical protein
MQRFYRQQARRLSPDPSTNSLFLGANLSLGRSGDRTPFRIRSKGTIFLLVEIVSLCWLGFGLLYPFRWLFLKVSKQ